MARIFNDLTPSDPFYMHAYEAMPDYAGPEALGSQFQLQSGDVWERNMLQKQNLDSNMARDKMNAANSSNWASARSGMAMRGGIDQGARERMAANSAKTGIMNNQEQSRLDQMARLGIGADAENRNIDAQKFNIQNSINQGLGRNAYNASMYDSLMKGYAANESAKAVEDPGGSWLCTEAKDNLSPVDWADLKKLRRWAMRKNKEETLFYIYRCKPLIDKMLSRGADWEDNKTFIKRVVELVKADKLEDAFSEYRNKVVTLINKYWPDCNDPVFQGGK